MAQDKVTHVNKTFTGQVGPVKFVDGKAQGRIPATMLAHFKRHPDRFTVEQAKRRQPRDNDPKDAPEKPQGADQGDPQEPSGPEAPDAGKGAENPKE